MTLYTRRWPQQPLLLQRGRLSPRLRCSTLASLVLSLSAVPLSWAAAAGDAVLSDTDLLADIAPVTTATRLSQSRVDAPAAITVIDRAMIDASGAQEIVDLFRLVPGFQAYHVNGNKFGVTAHGLGTPFPGRLEVMLDGRSIYLTAFSSPDWRTLGIGINDIERIEIARSPSAASWGANAFQGAINIITRDPLQVSGTQVNASGGSLDSRRVEVSHFGSVGNSEVRIAGGFQRNDGFDQGDEGRSRYVSLRQQISPSLADRVELQLGFSSGELGIGNSNAPFISQREYSSHFQSVTWQRNLAAGNDLQLRAYHNYLRYEMERIPLVDLLGPLFPQIPTAQLPFVLNGLGIPDEAVPANFEDGSTHRYDLELQQQLIFSPRLRALWGAGGRFDEGTSALLFNTDQTIREQFWRVFGNIEWRAADKWIWNLGLMGEHSDIAAMQWSPRLALNHKINATHSLRASYSLSKRTPSLVEAHQDTRLSHSNGNLILWFYDVAPRLEAEENRTWELGYFGQLTRIPLELDIRLFAEQIRNGIGRAMTQVDEPQALDPLNLPTGINIRTTNINNAAWDSHGVEVQLRYLPTPQRLVTLAYGYLDIDGGMTPGDSDRLDNPELDFANMAPRHTLALLGQQQFSHGFTLSGALYHQSASGWFIGDAIDAYTRVDLRLAKAFKVGRSHAEIAAVAQNVGSKYQEFQQRNEFDPRYFLNLNLRLR